MQLLAVKLLPLYPIEGGLWTPTKFVEIFKYLKGKCLYSELIRVLSLLLFMLNIVTPPWNGNGDEIQINTLTMTRNYLQSDQGRDWLASSTPFAASPLKWDFLYPNATFKPTGQLKSLDFEYTCYL